MSNYAQFDVTLKDKDGLLVHLGSETLQVHDLDADASLGTVTSDSDGIVAAGTLAVDAGTRVSFRIENYHGLAACIIQTTTSDKNL